LTNFYFKTIKFLISNIRTIYFKYFPRVSSITHNSLSLKFFNINEVTDYRINTFSSKEPDTLNWIDDFNDNCTFYDIGANVGLYSIYAAKRANCKVYAFEPSFLNLELLFKNIDLNEINEMITIIPIALNDTNTVSRFNMSDIRNAGALSSFGKTYDQKGSNLSIKKFYNTIGLKLDDLVNINNLAKPDYIKIDVDGIEHLVLSGAEKTISSAKSILVEITNSFKDQSNSCLEILKRNNFIKVSTNGEVNSNETCNQIWNKSL
tara:strand:- start:48 stop:836 length:789 start_codon:yes stop_codon:yes gene_type:complete